MLLCNPFGQEAVRIHRFLRVLSDRLSRAGVDVLRFDLFGTGDSAGEDEEGELDGWRGDLSAADRELRRRSGAIDVTWFGARLGASLAVRASGAADHRPQCLLLWDPVLDGAAYLDHLRLKHVETLESSYGIGGPNWRARLGDPAAFSDEALGFGLSAVLREQLGALTAGSLTPPSGIDITVLGGPSDGQLETWMRAQRDGGLPVRFVPMSLDFDWTAEEALNTALVPAEALRQCLTMMSR